MSNEKVDEPFVNGDVNQKVVDANTSLYPHCTKYTRMSAVISLYRIKATNDWTDKSFTSLLELLHDMLPSNNVIPKSTYEVKKFLKVFDLGYEKIHACENDCCLFTKENKDLETCPICGHSQWKVDKRTKRMKWGVSTKVLRYFPLIPRLRQMFQMHDVAELLTWHMNHKNSDGKMRHPVNCVSWDSIDAKWPDFSNDPQNLRFDLATDGFNPFSNLSSRYSCWPVMLVTYNLPHWLCMSKENMMLTLLIPRPKQLGNDIDIFLQPLIDGLKLLWDGVKVYDVVSKSNFNLRVVLMWTINDFPAYGNLVGCTTKDKTACLTYGEHTHSQWLYHSKKLVYMGHRRFLPPSHLYRRKKSWFDDGDEAAADSHPSSITPSSRKDSRRRIQNISLIKRKLAPFGRRSRPQTLLLKWKVEDRVDGRGEMDEDEKKLKSKDGGKDLHRVSRERHVIVSERKLAAGFWRFQKPEGAMIHEDKGRIEGGDLQWMTAGKGIVHSEMPSSIGTQLGL
ncbi:En/Spm-like transposon protein [Cucumis melo var. makuwa]|uniref:En/Spm-like transposon protein n=1 Tax=Cucumis melo var. makuwa TaxID=1194695 RepID=A0A5A7TNF1_CUCMM|nr:En/Spm-like transposon protein [Cucumis melo var. makuwa]